MRTCATCNKPLSKRNRYGLCQPCSARKTITAVNEAGLNATPDVIERRARTQSARRLSWCPPYLRPLHLAQLNKHMSAAESREIVLAQYDADLRRRRTTAA